MELSNRINSDMPSFAELLEMYRPLIESLASKYSFCESGETDDLIQEAQIALFGAFESFDPTQKDVTFGLYAKICIRNRLISFLRKNQRHSLISIEDSADDVMVDASPEERLIEKEEYQRLLYDINRVLSPLERDVLRLYLEEKPYKAVAIELKISEKSVDNAVCRIKKKILKFYNN